MHKAREYISKNLTNTKKIAREFIKELKGGDVVALFGDLGSGKTTFVQCIAKELGITGKIQSPTFIIVKYYKLNFKLKAKSEKPQLKIKNLIHADLFRLKSADEAKETGLLEYFQKPNTICFIEWPEIIEKFMPKNTIIIKFQHGRNISERKISVI